MGGGGEGMVPLVASATPTLRPVRRSRWEPLSRRTRLSHPFLPLQVDSNPHLTALRGVALDAAAATAFTYALKAPASDDAMAPSAPPSPPPLTRNSTFLHRH